MKNNKGLVITTIVIGVLLLLFGGYTAYDKLSSFENNNFRNDVSGNNNNETIVLNENFKNTTLFALKGEEEYLSLIALDNNGSETIIYDFNDYDRDIEDVRYYYDSTKGIIYLSIMSYEKNNHSDENLKFNIASIDLTTDSNNYKLNVLTEIKVERDYFDKIGADSITKLGNYIYFANSQLYKMNLNSYKVEKMNVTSEGRQIEVLGYNDNILIYNSGEEIYKFNLSNNNKEKIVENAIIEYIYGNEVIYVDVTDYKNIYKSYNLDTNEVKQISNDVGRSLSGFSYTIPNQKSYLSLIGDTFYYNNDKKFKLSCDDITIDVCNNFAVDSYIVYSDYIIVTGAANAGPNDSAEEYKALLINIDLKNQIIKSVNETDSLTTYRYITYIK